MRYSRQRLFFGPKKELKYNEAGQLTEASFSGFRVSKKIIERLLSESELQHINFDGCKFQLPIEEWVGKFGSKLQWFTLDWSNVNAACLSSISELKTLYSLRLSHNKINDEMLGSYKPNSELTHLGFWGNKITGSSLSILKDAPALESISFMQTKVTDDSLEHLSSCPLLESINLDSTPITGEGFKYLTGLSQLKGLGCEDTKLHSNSVRYINQMKKLESLTCRNTLLDKSFFVNLNKRLPLETIVTSVSFDQSVIEELQKLKKLNHLVISSPCSEQLEAKIVDSLPKVVVEFYPETYG